LSDDLFEQKIISGALVNDANGTYYPTYDGVPRMPTYDCGVFQNFSDPSDFRVLPQPGHHRPEKIDKGALAGRIEAV
jgi:hypothetical protein